MLFYERRIVGHMIDGCVRWTAARELRSKELEKLLGFIWTGWIQLFGPMASLTMDGDGGVGH